MLTSRGSIATAFVWPLITSLLESSVPKGPTEVHASAWAAENEANSQIVIQRLMAQRATRFMACVRCAPSSTALLLTANPAQPSVSCQLQHARSGNGAG